VTYASPSRSAKTTPVARKHFERGSLSFLVVERRGNWYKVLLPTRPNGSMGWIPKEVTHRRWVEYAIRINRARRELEVRHRGKRLLKTRVVVGAPATPTPRGNYYVTNLIKVIPPDSVFGPHAFGISAHSPTLATFNGKEPQIAIHGTNRPELVGSAVSNGCIRVPNRLIERMADVIPDGTPVFIT
jgi:hypothetical protein